jgi:hypothetical protein
LTNIYNERPAWLDNDHRDPDAAVAAACGWLADISEEDALAWLLALNLERRAANEPGPNGREGGQWLANMSQGVLPSGSGGMRSRSAIASPAS